MNEYYPITDLSAGMFFGSMAIALGLAIYYMWFKYGHFELKYNNYLQAFKLKVLFEELKKRGISLEELEQIIHPKTKNILKTVEEEVKGDTDKIKPKKEVKQK